MPKVLIADKMSEKAEKIFLEKGLDVDGWCLTDKSKTNFVTISEQSHGAVEEHKKKQQHTLASQHQYSYSTSQH